MNKEESIPWELLSEDDRDVFERVGMSLLTNGIVFNRDISQSDLASVCCRLLTFKAFVPDSGKNCIIFAVGDALHKYETLFGKLAFKKFLQRNSKIEKLRKDVLMYSGAALIYLQSIERQIKGCCAILKLKGTNITLEDFQSGDPARTRKTLGQLKRVLIGTGGFNEEFEKRFNQFVDDRNRLIHSLWDESMEMDEQIGLPKEEHFTRKLEFIFSLIQQGRAIETIFRGFLAASFEALPGSLKNDETIIPWKRYIPNYKMAVRS